MSDSAVLQESRALRKMLGRFRTYAEWQAHEDAEDLTRRVTQLLTPVWRLEAPSGGTKDSPRESFHVAHWNILHGLSYDRVLHALQHDERLALPDLLSVNEADVGLARTDNRNVAFDLARALGMHAAWTPLFLELEGGHLTPRAMQTAEQAESLFGLALLSRYPLGAAQRIELETPAAQLFDTERKVGDFIALVVEVRAPVPFTFVVTHLDVHGAPGTRRRQMRKVLRAVPPGPAIVCGDLNTTTFARGSWWRTAQTLATLALSPGGPLDARLQRPDLPEHAPREQLFHELGRQGFEHRAYNDHRTSLDLRLRDTHEYRVLPGWMRWVAGGVFRHVERRTHHRLDWMAARGFEPDPARPPYTRTRYMRGADAASDHAPIGCGLRLVAP